MEGSHISTDSSVGYTKDVEILGNTIQNASNLADIRSVGDAVEGQELYEIPVVSCGKNLVDNSKRYIVDMGHSTQRYVTINNGGYASSSAIFYLKQGTYSFSIEGFNLPATDSALFIWKKDKVHSNARRVPITLPFTIEEDEIGITFYLSTPTVQEATSLLNRSFMIEEGTVATPYEPYVEDKLTILSPVQLEKVGDVADRIICKDGVWGVEKNVVDKYVESTNITYCNVTLNENTVRFDTARTLITDRVSYSTGFCNKLPVIGDLTQRGIYFGDGVHFILSKTEIESQDKAGFVKWVETNNVVIKYPTTQPQFIPLPHDQQIKLRTFANKTNISFLTEIEGTIKAQVPKSLGATVNTHTEQISNLNKELDRVKKLEESTVSTVETESDFTTVEATSNGYFEDVKLEGKTLVNLISNGCEKHIHSTSENRIRRLKFLQPLKANTTYTIIFMLDNISLGDGTYESILVNTDTKYVDTTTIPTLNFGHHTQNGYIISTITPVNDIANFTIKLDLSRINAGQSMETSEIILLEGDHTQNPPSYFEGLKSVGDGVDEIVVSSVNENLFDINSDVRRKTKVYEKNKCILSYEEHTTKMEVVSDKLLVNFAQWRGLYFGVWLKPNTSYEISFDKSGDSYSNLIDGRNTKIVTTDSKGKAYWLFEPGSSGYMILSNIMVKETSVATNNHIQHQSDKKRLLFYNEETQAWEKPILREWDSIEKHADGKYYYHQRSGEVVLNGSENWGLNRTETNTSLFLYVSNIETHSGDTIIRAISDKIQGDSFANRVNDVEMIYTHNKEFAIRIVNSKLSTQDAQGFKQWLQANNVTVVYQLAKEKVYECTNIDLITYNGETNYIVESGAIVPRTTLKVHNNISNVVRTLQEKVSLLENKFIMGLKQVLAGDMYSLATLLYPEDFVSKEEPSDVPTLLI